jgi:hypothetical protein
MTKTLNLKFDGKGVAFKVALINGLSNSKRFWRLNSTTWQVLSTIKNKKNGKQFAI